MIIILLITLVLIIYFIEKSNRKSNNKVKEMNDMKNIMTLEKESNKEANLEEKINYKQYYQPKKYVITKNELNFYNVLMQIAKELDLVVFSQVSLYNILETKQDLDYKTKTIYFNKIAAKSIDFVLVDKNNCRIKLCIELDDITHKKEKRIERDKFINQLFKELEINLLRYPVYQIYYKDTLKRKIQENIKEHYYEK